MGKIKPIEQLDCVCMLRKDTGIHNKKINWRHLMEKNCDIKLATPWSGSDVQRLTLEHTSKQGCIDDYKQTYIGKFDISKRYHYENGFYLTCEPYRWGNIIAH